MKEIWKLITESKSLISTIYCSNMIKEYSAISLSKNFRSNERKNSESSISEEFKESLENSQMKTKGASEEINEEEKENDRSFVSSLKVLNSF